MPCTSWSTVRRGSTRGATSGSGWWWSAASSLAGEMREWRAERNSAYRQGEAGPPGPVAPHHLMIKRVALHRDAAGLLDQPADLRDRQLLRRVRAGVVVDLLVDHGA